MKGFEYPPTGFHKIYTAMIMDVQMIHFQIETRVGVASSADAFTDKEYFGHL